VIVHLPRPQSDDSASGNDAASEGDDEQARGHGAAKLHLEAADILVPFEVKVVEKMPLRLGDRPVEPVRTAGAGRVLDVRLRGSL
jgi:hypothetical protein